MPRQWKSLLLFPLFCSLLLAGCAPGEAGGPASPTAPGLTRSLEDYELVAVSPLSVAQSTTGLIGGSGGVLSLLGNTVTVPRGAVAQTTLFTLIRLPVGHIEVDLSAVRITLFGLIDVGAGGFLNDETVRLELSYAGATNVENPSELVVLYLRPDGAVEEIPTAVHESSRTVTVELEHFSRYAMAMDRR